MQDDKIHKLMRCHAFSLLQANCYENRAERRVTLLFKPGDIIHNRYIIKKKIGEGGMSEVYAAYDTAGDRLAALKCSMGNMPAAREYHIMKTLDHAGIPKAYELFVHNGIVVMSLEYIEGVTLSGIVRAAGKSLSPYSYEELIHIIISICMTADYLHREKGILYLDFKPSNIIAGSRGIYLIDFGAAMDVDSARKGKGVAIYGTKEYAAPEQMKAVHTIDVRTDIYQIGAVTDYIIKSAGIRDRAVKSIAKRCMCKRMSGRYASAGEAAMLLAGCINYNGIICVKKVQKL